MINIKQKYENLVYGYEPNEFLPVYRDGVLDNKNELLAYKAKLGLRLLGNLGLRALDLSDAMLNRLDQATR